MKYVIAFALRSITIIGRKTIYKGVLPFGDSQAQEHRILDIRDKRNLYTIVFPCPIEVIHIPVLTNIPLIPFISFFPSNFKFFSIFVPLETSYRTIIIGSEGAETPLSKHVSPSLHLKTSAIDYIISVLLDDISSCDVWPTAYQFEEFWFGVSRRICFCLQIVPLSLAFLEKSSDRGSAWWLNKDSPSYSLEKRKGQSWDRLLK